ncbi:hypothetical protein SOPP22_11370 [Shewanella sp. OPT22]|nr:hypothetical protein SOPP22_11370 [Shewanella sp. OPT22]
MQEVSTSVASAQDVVTSSDCEVNQNEPAFEVNTFTTSAGKQFICVPVANAEQESSVRTLVEAMSRYCAKKPSEELANTPFLDSQQVLFSAIAMQAELISTLNENVSELAPKVSDLEYENEYLLRTQASTAEYVQKMEDDNRTLSVGYKKNKSVCESFIVKLANAESQLSEARRELKDKIEELDSVKRNLEEEIALKNETIAELSQCQNELADWKVKFEKCEEKLTKQEQLFCAVGKELNRRTESLALKFSKMKDQLSEQSASIKALAAGKAVFKRLTIILIEKFCKATEDLEGLYSRCEDYGIDKSPEGLSSHLDALTVKIQELDVLLQKSRELKPEPLHTSQSQQTEATEHSQPSVETQTEEAWCDVVRKEFYPERRQGKKRGAEVVDWKISGCKIQKFTASKKEIENDWKEMGIQVSSKKNKSVKSAR